MALNERNIRWQVLAACFAWTWLALISTGAHASSMAVQELRAEPAATMPGERMPGVADCVPCALCFVAPVPGQQTFSAEAKEVAPLVPRVPVPSATPVTRIPPRNLVREHVPIRIAFCRWLD